MFPLIGHSEHREYSKRVVPERGQIPTPTLTMSQLVPTNRRPISTLFVPSGTSVVPEGGPDRRRPQQRSYLLPENK